MALSVADFGTLHRGSVRETEQVGPTQAVWVECPDIAPGKVLGPLSSLAPDLDVGERVLIACIGNNISDVVILQRWTPRWPEVSEVPGLATRLGELATDADVDLLTERVNRNTGDLADTRVELSELDRSLGYARSKIEELPESFQRQRAESDAALNDAIRALRTSAFGGPDRTRPPNAFVVWTTDSPSLAANTNFFMTSGWIKDDNDPDNMINLGNGTNASPVQITAPVAGKYVLECHAVTTATSGVLYTRLLMNSNLATSVENQVLGSSVANQAAGGTPEATFSHLAVERTLAAGDRFICSMYSTVAFVLKAGWFGGWRQTRFGIRYVGPPQL